VIRIAFMIDHLRVGGAQRHLLEVVGGLDRTRYSVEMWTATTEPGDLAPAFERAGAPVYSFGIDATMLSPKTLVAAGRAARELRARGVQILHGYLFEGNILAALVGTIGRFPVTLVSKRSLDRYRRLDRRLAAWLSNKLASRVLVNATAVGDLVAEHEWCPRERITLIPNGVGLPPVVRGDRSARAARSGPPSDSPLVGMVGRLSWKKGYEFALAAAAMVRAEVPGVRFEIVGDGPLRGDLERATVRAGLESAVRFLGQRSDVPALMSRFDCYVLSSIIEGMPNALLEAMALGRPVVTTSAGGSAEVVVDGDSGIVVPPRDAGALADGILRVLRDAELAARLGQAAEERVRRHFSREAMLASLDELYRSELHRSGHLPPVRSESPAPSPAEQASHG
jgi:glycosyltransferase involved in cell wall biosynthesis